MVKQDGEDNYNLDDLWLIMEFAKAFAYCTWNDSDIGLVKALELVMEQLHLFGFDIYGIKDVGAFGFIYDQMSNVAILLVKHSVHSCFLNH
jgi:hypothetical protein